MKRDIQCKKFRCRRTPTDRKQPLIALDTRESLLHRFAEALLRSPSILSSQPAASLDSSFFPSFSFPPPRVSPNLPSLQASSQCRSVAAPLLGTSRDPFSAKSTFELVVVASTPPLLAIALLCRLSLVRASSRSSSLQPMLGKKRERERKKEGPGL